MRSYDGNVPAKRVYQGGRTPAQSASCSRPPTSQLCTLLVCKTCGVRIARLAASTTGYRNSTSGAVFDGSLKLHGTERNPKTDAGGLIAGELWDSLAKLHRCDKASSAMAMYSVLLTVVRRRLTEFCLYNVHMSKIGYVVPRGIHMLHLPHSPQPQLKNTNIHR